MKIFNPLKWKLLMVLIMGSLNMNAQTIQHLSKEQQSIVAVSSLTASGDLEHLKPQLASALESGLSINQIKEILVQLYAYCGFPRSLNAINTFMEVLKERKANNIMDKEGPAPTPTPAGDKYERGRKVLETLTKTVQPKPAPGFGEFAPRIDAFLKEHLFADIFESDILTYQQRELVTISALASMTGLESQLRSHIAIGKNTGLSEPQLAEIVTILSGFVDNRQVEKVQVLFGKSNASPAPTQKDWMVRLAKIEVDSANLSAYRAALEEHAKVAVAAEPGVLTLYAVAEKDHPTRVMVLEIYASKEAYQSHLKTPHFQKYKSGTLSFVKHLELVELDPITFQQKK